jgi:hypothetical protein
VRSQSSVNGMGNLGEGKPVGPTALTKVMERAMGIEPTSEAWEASILPLYDARSGANFTRISSTFKVRKEGAAW